ncbi:MAG: Hsp70 family protein [Bacillus sp. (in: firmicutes)]
MEYIYKLAIDFGTTTTSVALRKYNPFRKQLETVVFEIEPASYVLPKNLKTVVCFGNNDEVWVGQDALIEASRNQLNKRIVHHVKWYLDKDVSVFHADFPYISKSITPVHVVTEIFREIFSRLRDEVNLSSLDGIVLGVPVGYSDLSKRRLLEALWQAGFYKSLEKAEDNTDFVSEPIAVALKFRENIESQHRVLVYDHGGGSLDVSVIDLVKVEDNIEPVDDIISKETLTMAGEDFTEDLFTHVFIPYYGFDNLKKDLKIECSNPNILWKRMKQSEDGIFLVERLEEAKINLSKKRLHRLKFDKGQLRVDLEITREDFNHSIAERLEIIEETIDNVLKPFQSRSIQINEIDYIFLAGGSSQIPAIRALLTRKFGEDKLPHMGIDDTFLSIVEGLAIAGVQNPNQRLRFDDVVDSTYGIYDEGRNQISVVVPKGEKVKNTKIQKITRQGKFKSYRTVSNNQQYVSLDIYQDEQKIGTVDVPLEPVAGEGKFDIYLQVDPQQGILTVEVFDKFMANWIPLDIKEKQIQIPIGKTNS